MTCILSVISFRINEIDVKHCSEKTGDDLNHLLFCSPGCPAFLCKKAGEPATHGLIPLFSAKKRDCSNLFFLSSFSK